MPRFTLVEKKAVEVLNLASTFNQAPCSYLQLYADH
ncbi:hypothetical protein P3T16_004889 [Paraburkholderia sp. GAS42]